MDGSDRVLVLVAAYGHSRPGAFGGRVGTICTVRQQSSADSLL